MAALPPCPWTPVSEPPPHAGPWLVTDGYFYAAGIYVYLKSFDEAIWTDQVSGQRISVRTITHWMPLPELPK